MLMTAQSNVHTHLDIWTLQTHLTESDFSFFRSDSLAYSFHYLHPLPLPVELN